MKNYFINIFGGAVAKILFSVFGNLFPLFASLLILPLIQDDFSFLQVFDKPSDFVIYSATFLVSAAYLWNQNNKNPIYLLGIILLSIVISILYSYPFFPTRKTGSDLFYSYFTFASFIITIIAYIYFEVTDHKNRSKVSYSRERDNEYKGLDKRFDNIK